MTDNVNFLVILIAKNDNNNIAAVQFEIKHFDFFLRSLRSSLIIFIRTRAVKYRNALDRLRVRMNIKHILFNKDNCIQYQTTSNLSKVHVTRNSIGAETL